MIRKIVISGGPCCGKSTLIRQLKRKGFSIIPESAREIIQKRKGFKATHEEILYRQRAIAAKQYEMEARAERELDNQIVFLDRGLVDNLAYCSIYLGGIPKDIGSIVKESKYRTVFVLDPLPFVHDGLRTEKGQEEALRIHKEIIKHYSQEDYNLLNVPVLSKKERLQYVLDKIPELRGENNGVHRKDI